VCSLAPPEKRLRIGRTPLLGMQSITFETELPPGARLCASDPARVLNSLLHKIEIFCSDKPNRHMLLSKEYVNYLGRELTKRLIAGKLIETAAVPVVTERVHSALLDELTLEDRINDEVRVILEAYSEEMRKTGANYQEMFRKVKSELVRKYKAVL
jgi:Protein of unknown function (DUF507)